MKTVKLRPRPAPPDSTAPRGWFTSAELCALFGCSASHFRRELQPLVQAAAVRQDANGRKFYHGRSLLDAWAARQSAKPDSPTDAARTRELLARAEASELKAARIKGALIAKTEHEAILERECSARSEWFVGVLDRLAAEMPARLAGKSAPDVRDELLRTFAAVRLAGFGEQTAVNPDER